MATMKDTAKPKTPRKAAPKATATARTPRAPRKKAATASASAPLAAFDTSKIKEQAGTMFEQAGEKLRGAADRGRQTAGGAIGDLASMVDDVAKSIDEKLGPQYGDYARKAAGAVNGVAETLNSKDVDALMDDAREFVRKKPAVAIGIAAAVGFALTRLIKAGNDE